MMGFSLTSGGKCIAGVANGVGICGRFPYVLDYASRHILITLVLMDLDFAVTGLEESSLRQMEV